MKPYRGRHLTSGGYVIIAMGALTPRERDLADTHNLWIGVSRASGCEGRRGVKEHHLAAVQKYGRVPAGMVVRHVNGNKVDNRPENLVIGTHKDNSLDHRSAVIEMMLWRERALLAEGKVIADAL